MYLPEWILTEAEMSTDRRGCRTQLPTATFGNMLKFVNTHNPRDTIDK